MLSSRQASEADVQSQAISSPTSTTKKEVIGMESTTPTTTSASLDSWLEPSKYLKKRYSTILIAMDLSVARRQVKCARS